MKQIVFHTLFISGPSVAIVLTPTLPKYSVFECGYQTVTNVVSLTLVETCIVELPGAAFKQVTRLSSMISLWCLDLDHMI